MKFPLKLELHGKDIFFGVWERCPIEKIPEKNEYYIFCIPEKMSFEK